MSDSPATNPSAIREMAMLEWIHDHAPYGVITTDREFRIQSWNRWMEVHSGKERQKVLRQHLLELYPDLKERGLEMRFQRALAGEISVLSTALHGYLLPLDAPVRDARFDRMRQTARIAPLAYQQEIVGTIVVIEDVTDREIQASILHRQHHRDKILSWALAHLLEAREPRRTIRDLFCKVAEYLDFDAYLLYLFEPSESSLKLNAAGGISPETEQELSSLNADQALGALLCSLSEPRVYENIQAADWGAAGLGQFLGLRACALLPLATAEGLLGSLCFGTRSRATLQEGELDLLSTIAKYLALALQKETTRQALTAAQTTLNLHAQELERQVAERTANLRDIIGELETFSHTLAHDLRAPIRALIGYSEVLLEDYSTILPDEGKTIIGRLHRACKQLDGLTKDLLEFSKVSRQDIQLTSVDLELLVSEIMFLAPPARGSIDVRRPLHRVIAHRSSLQQCLSNLIDNAFKFSKEGRPPRVSLWTEIRSDPRPIGTSAHDAFSPVPPAERPVATSGASDAKTPQPGARVRIIVEDEGVGIPVHAHGKIFGIFERGTSSPQYPGSGIGLAIVARAMLRMGGTYGVESTPGTGSRFWLELPQA
jgi:signal transduction histidine kinase